MDLICLMTYDQHTRWTPPGPVAGWEWTVENLDYALKSFQRKNLSLGIPLYGYHWFAGSPDYAGGPDDKEDGEHPNITAEYISTENALLLAREYKGMPQWDAADHQRGSLSIAIRCANGSSTPNRALLRTDTSWRRSAAIQGFCSWVLGTEDPGIWELLPVPEVARVRSAVFCRARCPGHHTPNKCSFCG